MEDSWLTLLSRCALFCDLLSFCPTSDCSPPPYSAATSWRCSVDTFLSRQHLLPLMLFRHSDTI